MDKYLYTMGADAMRKTIVLAFCYLVLFQTDLLAENGGEGAVITRYDVTEEAIINASPELVYHAIIDVYDGKTSWWLPDFSSRLCQGNTSGDVDAVYEVTIHALRPIKFKTKTVEAKQNEMLRVDYVEGAFVGRGLWKFESVEGKTRVSLRWRTNPSGWFMRMAAPIYPIAKDHSRVMQAGFSRLKTLLEQ
jgi:ribosome-associated toxin RatA of RatAB toxin-antitoxin module